MCIVGIRSALAASSRHWGNADDIGRICTCAFTTEQPGVMETSFAASSHHDLKPDNDVSGTTVRCNRAQLSSSAEHSQS